MGQDRVPRGGELRPEFLRDPALAPLSDPDTQSCLGTRLSLTTLSVPSAGWAD